MDSQKIKILINRTDAIGDTLLTFPIASYLKAMPLDYEIHFLVKAPVDQLIGEHPHLDQVHVLPSRGKIAFLFKLFKSFQFQQYLYVGGTHLASLMAWITRVPRRGGLKSRWPSFLFLNLGIRQRRSFAMMHESEYNLALLSGFGIDYHFEELSRLKLGFEFDVQEQKKAREALQSLAEKTHKNLREEYLVFHPGMTGHTLNWPIKNYARLIDQIEKDHPGKYSFVLSFTPHDQDIVQEFRKHLSRKNHELFQNHLIEWNGLDYGLKKSAMLYQNAAGFIGPSTGPTHMANLVGTPVLSFYSPIRVQSSMRWAPFYRAPEKLQVMVPDVVCGEEKKCAGESCPYFECMDRIEISEAKEKLFSMINAGA